MILAKTEVEPHGYKLPANSMVVLELAYVQDDVGGTLTNKIILPAEVVIVAFQVRCENIQEKS